ncbi:UNVERIFIED_CONTAM: hypothetical protein FKN15_042425 [Acipenser sinensis]
MVQKLTKYLDPNELGQINFKDFCYGVFAIKGCEEILKNALGARSAPCRQYEAEYEEYNYQTWSSFCKLVPPWEDEALGFQMASNATEREHIPGC